MRNVARQRRLSSPSRKATRTGEQAISRLSETSADRRETSEQSGDLISEDATAAQRAWIELYSHLDALFSNAVCREMSSLVDVKAAIDAARTLAIAAGIPVHEAPWECPVTWDMYDRPLGQVMRDVAREEARCAAYNAAWAAAHPGELS